ncbi:MAG: plasmid mobilization relaxosome protein MobC [Parabacteroides sp.]|nr:plasmid mobilization relaxosome protein MobC [Parabacteroides sp.]
MDKREINIHVRVTKAEYDRIRLKMDEVGIRSIAAYMRKMGMDGYCINLDLQDVKDMVSLLRICSNNLNQYAKRANETGNIYEADINDLQERLEEIWTDMKEVLVRLASIQ